MHIHTPSTPPLIIPHSSSLPQELSMVVPGQEGLDPKPFSIQGTYDNMAYNADMTDAKGDVMGERLVDGTAKLVLPGNTITKETREETQFQMTSFTQVRIWLSSHHVLMVAGV